MIPIIFQTEFFTLHTLWVFFAIGLIAGTYTLIKLSERHSLKIQFLSENSWKLIIWTLIGARILGVISNYSIYFYELKFSSLIQIFYIWDKGLHFWGGAIAFFIALYFICKKNEQNFLKWLDVIIPSTIVGIAIGSLGAFFDGINYGKETSLPWGVNFENPSIKYAVPIHPTQIYAFIYSAGIAALLILAGQISKIKNLDQAGLVGLCGITLFGLMKFLEEFVRGDDTWLLLGIRVPQIITLLITITAGIFLFLRYNKPINKTLKK